MPIPLREWSKAALATAGMAVALANAPLTGLVITDLAVHVAFGALIYAVILLALDGLGARRWLGARIATRLGRRAAA